MLNFFNFFYNVKFFSESINSDFTETMISETTSINPPTMISKTTSINPLTDQETTSSPSNEFPTTTTTTSLRMRKDEIIEKIQALRNDVNSKLPCEVMEKMFVSKEFEEFEKSISPMTPKSSEMSVDVIVKSILGLIIVNCILTVSLISVSCLACYQIRKRQISTKIEPKLERKIEPEVEIEMPEMDPSKIKKSAARIMIRQTTHL